jgi:hypothetical protein
MGLTMRTVTAPRRPAALVALILTLAALILAPGSMAGQYHVYACRTPAGEAAPADGWSGESFGPWDRAEDTCGKPGGALVAALGDETTHPTDVDPASWIFSTPADDTMVGATLWRAGDAEGGEVPNATYEFWLAGPTEFSTFDQCAFQFECPAGIGDPADPLASANRVPVPRANLGARLYAYAACGGEPHSECPAGKGDPHGYAAVVYLYAADIVLEQSAGPTVAGTSDLIFTASDPGAGVWEATFSVDGKLVQSTVPNENGGRCRNVGQSTDGLPGFLYLQPCLSTESVDVPFNTTAVPNGQHHLVVTIFDAAGNSAPVLDKQINFENPVPPPPGLVPASSAKPGPGVKPGPRRLPRARVTLRVEPRYLGLGQRIYFSGRVLGGHLPTIIGKLLLLEARLVGGGSTRGRRRSGRCGTSCVTRRGKWFGFAEPRAGAQGRYHGSYRFNVFVGPGEYELRVLAKAETGYPFSAGTSNVVRVRVS